MSVEKSVVDTRQESDEHFKSTSHNDFDKEEPLSENSGDNPYHFSILKKSMGIPLFFIGLGFYRAWIEIVFVGSFLSFPSKEIAGQDAFDLTMVVVLFGCAILSKRIAPFFNKRTVYWSAAVCLVASTVLMFSSILCPEIIVYTAWPAVFSGGIGVALLILLWSELYGSLNPIRVGLYYSLSFILGAITIYIAMGFDFFWLYLFVLILPIASLACVSRGFRSLPRNELPHPKGAKFSFPWKTVLLMAVYAFAFGLKEVNLYDSPFGPHSSLGTLVVALLVFLGISIRGSKFDIGFIYRIALPLAMGAFLLLPSVGIFSKSVSDFCMTASYTSFAILIMLILANMSYRYGISAIWLFGIERGVRALFSFCGRKIAIVTQGYELIPGEPDSAITLLVIILVSVLAAIMFSEKELSSRWGVNFLGSTSQADSDFIIKKQELANSCHETAKKYRLSHREEEVLFLLAQHKTAGIIERELFITNNTAKTHIKNIYRKLDIHSRQEMFELLEL